MSRYNSIDDFRSALNDLVGDLGRHNPAPWGKKHKPRRNPRARRNMAMEFDGIKFDTVEELLAYKRAVGAPAAPAEAPAFTPASRQLPTTGGFFGAGRQTALKPKAPAHRPRRKGAEVKDPEGPISYKQAQVIGMSVGGMAELCPQYVGEKVSFQTALQEMGLTAGGASAVLNALEAAGVARWHRGIKLSEPQKAAARVILLEVGGIACPTARNNPVSWSRAY